LKQRIKRWLVLAVGWAFLLLGIAGLFLPILQGVLFILIGLMILSTEYVWAHRVLHRTKERFPRLAQMFDRAETRAREWLHKFGHRRHKAGPKPAPCEEYAPPQSEKS